MHKNSDPTEIGQWGDFGQRRNAQNVQIRQAHKATYPRTPQEELMKLGYSAEAALDDKAEIVYHRHLKATIEQEKAVDADTTPTPTKKQKRRKNKILKQDIWESMAKEPIKMKLPLGGFFLVQAGWKDMRSAYMSLTPRHLANANKKRDRKQLFKNVTNTIVVLTDTVGSRNKDCAAWKAKCSELEMAMSNQHGSAEAPGVCERCAFCVLCFGLLLFCLF